MDASRLLALARRPGLMDRDSLHELRQAMRQYPGSGLLAMLYLENLLVLRDPFFKEELPRLFLLLPDPALLYAFSKGECILPVEQALKQRVDSNAQQEPEVKPEIAAEKPDALLEPALAENARAARAEKPVSRKKEEPAAAKQPALEAAPAKTSPLSGLVLEPSMDYLSMMEGSQEAEVMQDDEIDRIMEGFKKTLENRPAAPSLGAPVPLPEAQQPLVEPDEDEGLDESCFTETLARIYIRQKRYDKALEILEKISLINPKKNAYFADQIRFLRILINKTKTK